MACTLLPIDNSVCAVSDGGIRVSYVAPLSNLTAITLTGGEVSALTVTGGFEKFIYDDDDTAYFNQVGERSNLKHTYTQTAFLKFAGINQAKRAAVEAMTACCEGLVAVHILNNGETLIQGVEETAATPFFKRSKKRLQATVSIMTGTGAEEDRVELQLISTSLKSALFGSNAIDEAYMDAL